MEENKLIPGRGYCIVEPYKEENVGGFQTPDTTKETDAQLKGKVIAINQKSYISEYGGIIPFNPDVKSGSIIIHKAYGHQEFKHNMKKYRAVRHIDICIIIKP